MYLYTLLFYLCPYQSVFMTGLTFNTATPYGGSLDVHMFNSKGFCVSPAKAELLSPGLKQNNCPSILHLPLIWDRVAELAGASKTTTKLLSPGQNQTIVPSLNCTKHYEDSRFVQWNAGIVPRLKTKYCPEVKTNIVTRYTKQSVDKSYG